MTFAFLFYYISCNAAMVCRVAKILGFFLGTIQLTIASMFEYNYDKSKRKEETQ